MHETNGQAARAGLEFLKQILEGQMAVATKEEGASVFKDLTDSMTVEELYNRFVELRAVQALTTSVIKLTALILLERDTELSDTIKSLMELPRSL